MRGRAAAAKRRFEEAVAAAWHGEAFARSKKLPPLDRLFSRGGRVSDDGAVLAMFEGLAARSVGRGEA